MFVLYGNIFSQSDSLINYSTKKVFLIEYVNTDSTKSEINEAEILSLSGLGLNVKYEESDINYTKSIELKNLRKVGYKTGNNGWKYAGYTFVGSLAASYLTLQLFGKAIRKDIGGDQAGFTMLFTTAYIVLGATVLGGLVGIADGDYHNYDLRKYPYEKNGMIQRLRIIINEGIKYGY